MIANVIGKMLSRGRVTIPIELRRKRGMKPGTRLIVREVDDQIVVMTMEQQVRLLQRELLRSLPFVSEQRRWTCIMAV